MGLPFNLLGTSLQAAVRLGGVILARQVMDVLRERRPLGFIEGLPRKLHDAFFECRPIFVVGHGFSAQADDGVAGWK